MKRNDVLETLDTLSSLYPEAHCELNYNSELNLTIAVLLSAQCTDAMVNKVTESLFAEFRTAKDYVRLTIPEIEERIKRLGLYRNKAKHIYELVRILLEKYNGEIPRTRESLMELPGVGRKTANVVLATAFDIPTIAVDTHVERLSHRIGLIPSTAKTPMQIEERLMKAIPEDRWIFAHHGLIWHGRRMCGAKKPACERCPLAERLCRYAKTARRQSAREPISAVPPSACTT